MLSPLSDETALELVQCLRLEKFPKQTLIVREGQVSDKMYFLVKGSARAYFFQGEKEYTDWFVFENMFMCSMASFFGQLPSMQVIETLEPTETLVFSRADLDRLCARHHDMQTLNSVILAQSLVVLQQNIINQRFKTAPERYRLLLLTYPQVLQRVPLKFVASYLGVTQETLSRIRSSVII